jgi:hypothetical protein
MMPAIFSPDGDGENDLVQFSFAVSDSSEISSWKFTIRDPLPPDSAPRTQLPPFVEWKGDGSTPVSIMWNGRGSNGGFVESAMDYPYELLVFYRSGKTLSAGGIVPVDVMVVNEWGKLRVRVAGIVFRSDRADFVGLDKGVIDRNEAMIARLAAIFGKYGDYQIRIEGHANSVSRIMGYSAAKIAAEEKNELIPLSTARAAAIRTRLIQKGIAASRMTVYGLGSSEPLVDFKDAANRWKNRRVEFVLVR